MEVLLLGLGSSRWNFLRLCKSSFWKYWFFMVDLPYGYFGGSLLGFGFSQWIFFILSESFIFEVMVPLGSFSFWLLGTSSFRDCFFHSGSSSYRQGNFPEAPPSVIWEAAPACLNKLLWDSICCREHNAKKIEPNWKLNWLWATAQVQVAFRTTSSLVSQCFSIIDGICINIPVALLIRDRSHILWRHTCLPTPPLHSLSVEGMCACVCQGGWL